MLVGLEIIGEATEGLDIEEPTRLDGPDDGD